MLTRLLELIAPPGCLACEVACARPDEGAGGLCPACRRGLPAGGPVSAPPGVNGLICAGAYEGAIRDLAHALKFRRRLAVAPLAARMITAACPPGFLAGTVVAVPPARRRLLVRGFDPAEEIAIEVARAAGLPLERPLSRAPGPRQMGRSRERRLAEPPVVGAAPGVPDEVVLVDDVLTTGATLGSCAAALRRAGAQRVVAVTLAASHLAEPLSGALARRRIVPTEITTARRRI